jgi:hypothetical protein
MTKFNFQNATIKTVRLLGVTTIAVTLAAAHPGAHADQRPSLVDNANHSDVSTAVGTVNALQRWPMATRQQRSRCSPKM